MNNARMWTVVNPTVGIPLFFVGVAATSLIVHTSVMTNSAFVAQFFSGQEMAANVDVDSDVKTASINSGEAFIVLPDGRTGRVVFDAPVTLASVDGTVPPPAD